MFKVFNRKKNQVDLLENPISPVIVNELGGIGELTFSVPSTYKHLELEGYIQVENDHEYVIKEIVTHGTNREVVCMLNIEEILGMAWSKFISRDNTLMKCAELVLSGTKWRAIDKSSCNVKRNLYGTVTNSYNLLQMMCTVYNVEFIFDTYNKTVTFVDKVGKDAGVYFINDINLKQLNVDTHTHKYITRVIPIGKDGLTIESVNNGKNYLENKSYSNKNIYGIWQSDKHDDPSALKADAKRFLDEMAIPYETYEVVVDDLYALKGYTDFKYGLGDVVTIIDGDTETRIQQRIIQRTYNLLEPDKDTIHIANKDATFEDYYKRLQTIADMTQSVIGSDGSINGGNISDGTISGDKIENDSINSDHISSGSITSTHIKAEQILADHIMSNQITTNHLVAESITSDHIQSNTIDTKHLKANIITSDHIQSNTINSNHISANTITSGHIQSGAITAGSGIIADGAIGNAQISKIDAGKIEAGTIDTSKVTIQGANGHLRLRGNRMQVFDGVGNQAKERVSVGDVNGDGTVYGLRVRGADGQTILLDENGVTSEGITDGSITNDKINEDANIDGAKLNINSVINKINTDGTEVIQGTKVEVDGTNLGVKLSEITNKQTEDSEKITQAYSQIEANEKAIKLKVDEQVYTSDKKDMTSKLEKNTSEISTMKGQIALKVEQTDIENAKNEINNSVDTKIASAKSELKVTTDAISQTVSNLSQTVSTKADNSVVTSMNKKVSSLETNVNGIRGSVSSLEKTTTTLGTQVSDAQSTANNAVNKANNAQSTANTNKNNITNLQGEVTTVKNNVASLEVTTSGISQKVSSVETTTATLTSKVNAAQSTANQAKTDASTANTNATNAQNTANTANNNANQALTQITTTNNKLASIESNVNSITSRVSNVETKTTTVSDKLDNLSVGARNYLPNTDFSDSTNLEKWYCNAHSVNSFNVYNFGANLDKDSFIRGDYALRNRYDIAKAISLGKAYAVFKTTEDVVLEKNTEYTISFYMYKSGNCGKCHMSIFPVLEDGSLGTKCGGTSSITEYTGAFEKHTVTFTTNAESNKFSVRFYNYYKDTLTTGNSDVHIYHPMLVKGSKALDWTTAPEDTKEKLVSQETRISSAEQKITDKAITSVVQESQFIKDMDGKISTNKSNISKVEQTANSITSRVEGLDGKYTQLKQTVDGIDVTGRVSFSDLSTSGRTTINGSNITTGTINTNRVNIKGGTTKKIVIANDNYCVYDGSETDVNRKVFVGFRTNTATNVPSVMLGYNGINPSVDGAVTAGGTYTTYSHYPNNNNPEDINQSYGALAFKYGANYTQFSTLNMYQNGDIDLKAGASIYFRPNLRAKGNHVFGIADTEVGCRVPFKCTSTIYANGNITTDGTFTGKTANINSAMSAGSVVTNRIDVYGSSNLDGTAYVSGACTIGSELNVKNKAIYGMNNIALARGTVYLPQGGGNNTTDYLRIGGGFMAGVDSGNFHFLNRDGGVARIYAGNVSTAYSLEPVAKASNHSVFDEINSVNVVDTEEGLRLIDNPARLTSTNETSKAVYTTYNEKTEQEEVNIDYTTAISTLWKAVQELKSEVDSLKQENNELKLLLNKGE